MFNLNLLYNVVLKVIAVGLACYAFSTSATSHSVPLVKVSTKNIAVHENNKKIKSRVKQSELFGKLRKNFNSTTQFSKLHHFSEVQKQLKKLNQSKKSFVNTTALASPHLYYILGEVEKRNLPGELALLPMLESNFRPQAVSNKGAAGLWQFMPSTGRQFGLKQSAGYDGRKDVKASTKAALNYLEYLHKKFNRDWVLALAAYNAGEGAVERAIKRNQKAGKPTSFWFLKLPKQTREYVPKFLAITQMIY